MCAGPMPERTHLRRTEATISKNLFTPMRPLGSLTPAFALSPGQNRASRLSRVWTAACYGAYRFKCLAKGHE